MAATSNDVSGLSTERGEFELLMGHHTSYDETTDSPAGRLYMACAGLAEPAVVVALIGSGTGD